MPSRNGARKRPFLFVGTYAEIPTLCLQNTILYSKTPLKIYSILYFHRTVNLKHSPNIPTSPCSPLWGGGRGKPNSRRIYKPVRGLLFTNICRKLIAQPQLPQNNRKTKKRRKHPPALRFQSSTAEPQEPQGFFPIFSLVGISKT